MKPKIVFLSLFAVSSAAALGWLWTYEAADPTAITLQADPSLATIPVPDDTAAPERELQQPLSATASLAPAAADVPRDTAASAGHPDRDATREPNRMGSVAAAPAPDLTLAELVVASVKSGAISVQQLNAEDRALVETLMQEAQPSTADSIQGAEQPVIPQDQLAQLLRRHQDVVDAEATANSEPAFTCPPAGQLPQQWQNEYNRAMLRARGCTI